jgi:transcriptional regulator with XRE-family HTH domain
MLKRLKVIREARRLSLRQLAKAPGVGLTTLVRLETGMPACDPRLSTLERLAKALNVSVAALLQGGRSEKGER